MLGAGAFVSLAMAQSIIGPGVIVAVVLAALLAFLNGLSSAQLAASHPVAGGTYEYAHHYGRPAFGRVAGWMFIAAKSASAATAALACSAYILQSMGVLSQVREQIFALVLVAVLTAVVAGGIQRSNRVNAIFVSVAGLSLLALGAFALPAYFEEGTPRWTPFFATENERGALQSLLEATALVFVAYTGYGRIATLGEEVREPARTIPRAILTAVGLSMFLYLVIATIGLGMVSETAPASGSAAAPLSQLANQLNKPVLTPVVAAGALAAMLGVLLNLLLGLSRVYLAMARRRDIPGRFAQLNPDGTTPRSAVVLSGIVVAALISIGDVRIAWSFSAFTVLIYYGITNYTALLLPDEARRYPRFLAICGLAGCLGLSFWVDTRILLCGIALIGGVLIWNALITSRRRAQTS